MSVEVRRDTALKIGDFDYVFPGESIADKPMEPRDASRLLIVDREKGSFSDKIFRDITDNLTSGDILVLNNTKVFQARLNGRKKTGGKVEVLFLGPSKEDAYVWRVLTRPSLKEGHRVCFVSINAEKLEGVCMGRDAEGIILLKFQDVNIPEYLKRHGLIPLPPYIKRAPNTADETRYQTVYAERQGSVAAPTAGFHFTKELLDKIRSRGIQTLFVTLHVGYGTFKPVENINEHVMHTESFEVSEKVAQEINRAKREKKRVWVVGTTTLRALETCALKGELIAGSGETDLLILPPFHFEIATGLVTNFHLPRTTLLMLVSAFMGHDLMRRAYRHAIDQGYRLYSYGDAMMIR